jgi:hypothetical protein
MRRPPWAGEGFIAAVNGALIAAVPPPGSYVEMKQTWKTGDTIELRMPKSLRLERFANDAHGAAIMWGPLVMAGDLGPEPPRGTRGGQAPVTVDIPVIVSASASPADWLTPIAGKPGEFRTSGVGTPREVELVPFYRLHRHVYMGYFDIYTPSDWKKKAADENAAMTRQRELEAATVVLVQPGNVSETQANQQGESTSIVRVDQRAGRTGRGWFSYDVPVESTHQNVLIVTYHADSRRARSFDILVDGQPLAQERFDASSEDRFFDREYEIPIGFIPQGKPKVAVRFQATGGNDIAAVFGIRVVRR